MTVMDFPKEPYPGSLLGAKEVFRLAESYRLSALHMLGAKWANKPKSSAPFRLVALHAIELYLNAYLLAAGLDAAVIRGMQHDLARRTDLVKAAGMALRPKTEEHLRGLSERREYLVSRYGSHEINGFHKPIG